MKITLLALVIVTLGGLTGGWLVRFPVVHEVAGRIFQRGKLIATVGEEGIFEADLSALARHKRFCAGNGDDPVDKAENATLRGELIAAEALRTSTVELSDSEAGLATLRHQFADDGQFRAARRVSGVSLWRLKRKILEVNAGERWIESRIASQILVSDAEAQKYFEQHQAEFLQPLRIRARHIFLAAADGSPSELLEAKQRAMEDIMVRLNRGEDFGQLAAAISEDEATKAGGGDLGFFAADRVPAEFFAGVQRLMVNAPPQLLQTHLGFHAIQVTDIRLARPLSFAEALPEIASLLEAEKRRKAVDLTESELAQRARFLAE